MKKTYLASLLLITGFMFSQDSGSCTAGDCFDGQGTYTWSDGENYEGAFSNGERNGQGAYTWANGNKYVGEWKDGKMTGQGTYTWAEGAIYEGEWKDGKENGQGTYTSANGDIYEGAWKDGKQNGQGTYTWSDGENYEGAWKDGKQNGQGTYTWASGNKYVGEYKDGQRNGQGTITKIDYVDKGNWMDNKRNGIFERYTLDGYKIYEIEYVDGLVNGYVRLYNKKREVVAEDFLIDDDSSDKLIYANKVYKEPYEERNPNNSDLTMCADDSFYFYCTPSPSDKQYFSEMNIGPFNLDNIDVFSFCSKRVYVDSKKPVTGFVYELYSNGNTKYRMWYKNGKYKGSWILLDDFKGESRGMIKSKKLFGSIRTKFLGPGSKSKNVR